MLVACAVLAAHVACADYIYFMLDNPPLPDDTLFVTVSQVGHDFVEQTIPVADFDMNRFLELYAGGATESSGRLLDSTSTEPIYAYLSGSSNEDRVLFEAWVYDEEADGLKNFYLYSNYMDNLHNHIVMGSDASGGVPLHVGAVPEPTSGMLALLGLAMLSLRRGHSFCKRS